MKNLWPSAAALVFALGTAASAQDASPQDATVDRAAIGQPGKDIQVGVFFNVRADCRSGPLPGIKLATRPEHGAVTVKKGSVTATNYKQCLALEVPAFVAYYRSKPDFVGVDAITLAWDFIEGTTFGIVLRLSEREFLKENAVATDHQSVEVQLSDPAATFEKLRKAMALQVMAGAKTFEFDFGLAGPANVLSALMQCVAQQLPPAARPARPAGPNVKPSAPPRPALDLNPAGNLAGNIASNDEAATLVDRLLAEARISDVQVLAREKIPPGMRGDVV
jgi:hypothetical protein